jgi:hypothetical protein
LYSSQSFVMAFVPNVTTSAFGALADDRISFDEAIVSPKVSVAQVGQHVLVASFGNLWEAPMLRKKPEDAVLVIFDEDFFELNTFGEHGRNRQLDEGEVVSDEGVPLDVEKVFDEIADPTTSHLELLCRLAGITRDDLRHRLAWYTLTPRWKKGLARLFGR